MRSRADKAFGRLTRRPGRSLAAVALLSLVASVGLALFRGLPLPEFHDEFSYLLAADTFAHGRLSNPTHPLWVHFETIHVLQQPTYASKYPPAQGLLLSAGQRLGHPAFGVWIGTALACAAVCWMLEAWVRPRWALLGAMMVAIHPEILSWTQTYWGGSLAMAGGALLLGGFRRTVRAPRVGDALWMALGIAILANSRPYEGFVLCVVVGLALIVSLLRGETPLAAFAATVVPPVAAVLALTAVAIGYYNFRVTGNALEAPYAVHYATYEISPLFVWQHWRPEPVYRHEVLRKFHADFEPRLMIPPPRRPDEPKPYSPLVDTLRGAARKLGRLFLGAFPPFAGTLSALLLAVPWIVLPWAVARDRRTGLAALLLAGFLVSPLLSTFLWPRYAAPGVALVALLTVEGLRRLRACRRRRRFRGRTLARAVFALWVAVCAASLIAEARAPRTHEWKSERARIVETLESAAGRQLVIVRYSKDHDVHHEWVYNAADIDDAKVVWAREMDATENRRLLEYFDSRRVWLLDADARPPRLLPYPVGDSPASPPE